MWPHSPCRMHHRLERMHMAVMVAVAVAVMVAVAVAGASEVRGLPRTPGRPGRPPCRYCPALHGSRCPGRSIRPSRRRHGRAAACLRPARANTLIPRAPRAHAQRRGATECQSMAVHACRSGPLVDAGGRHVGEVQRLLARLPYRALRPDVWQGKWCMSACSSHCRTRLTANAFWLACASGGGATA